MPLMLAIVGFVVTFLSGGAAGAIINQVVTRRRDVAARKRQFRAFLQEWRIEIASAPSICAGTDWGSRQVFLHPCLQPYQNRLAAFRSEIERVRDCFNKKPGFVTFAQSLRNLEQNNWNNKQPHIAILEAMDQLIEFVENN